MAIENIQNILNSLANPEKAKLLARYFKTGKGQYGEGDIFLGIVVPQMRKVAHSFIDADLKTIQELLHSKIHEYRLTALEILVAKYERTKDSVVKDKIYNFYLKNTKYINNWDLVDLSCSYIVGNYLLDKKRDVLYKLAYSKNIWERRISIISTSAFINKGQFKDTFKIAKILLSDEQDLIHKAVGWMLREVGKRISRNIEKKFLNKYCKKMPSIMLSYATEHFSDIEKLKYRKMNKVKK